MAKYRDGPSESDVIRSVSGRCREGKLPPAPREAGDGKEWQAAAAWFAQTMNIGQIRKVFKKRKIDKPYLWIVDHLIEVAEDRENTGATRLKALVELKDLVQELASTHPTIRSDLEKAQAEALARRKAPIPPEEETEGYVASMDGADAPPLKVTAQ